MTNKIFHIFMIERERALILFDECRNFASRLRSLQSVINRVSFQSLLDERCEHINIKKQSV